MAETNKLSVEKALQKLLRDEPVETASEQRDEKAEALREEIKRMRAQRSRLERSPGKGK
ncbi:hypothetical protein M2175_005124 [Bradyrhizobium elkanii]|uniref:hypothetical protein n=1 Tax=Bradyrhizobium TaxID=374 RepID=UPI000A6C1733|nr:MULTISPECIES: hypothetical protein [Bradyrhizobium]MCS3930093.1 hypothetical protein [Bradyrhizobium elkanii]MCS3970650.1 hypothetical protein [Bradyrhizobium japonicum]